MKKITSLLLLLCILLISCSNEPKESPSDVVLSLFEQAKNNEYTKMKSNISTSFLKVIDDAGYGLNAYAEDITDDGNIDSLEITKEEIKGEGAKVYYKAIYTDGTIIENQVSLIKESKKWVLSPNL